MKDYRNQLTVYGHSQGVYRVARGGKTVMFICNTAVCEPKKAPGPKGWFPNRPGCKRDYASRFDSIINSTDLKEHCEKWLAENGGES